MCQYTISLYDFTKRFSDEKSARLYLEARRWKDGVRCPHCNNPQAKRLGEGQYFQCNMCRRKFTVRTGTLFERSHIPLDKWLYAMYLMATARKGISSMQLSKEIGITQKSAWFMLHRLREACGGDDEMLSGIVEVDETYIGGKEGNKHKNKKSGKSGAYGKTAVLGMKQRGGKVKATPIPDSKFKTIKKVLHDNIARPGVICTDEATVYTDMPGYRRYSVNHSAKEYVNKMASTNSIESVWALLKRGHYGVYHHFSAKHLRRYVDEFTYRLNEGNVRLHTMLRINALCDKSFGKRVTYEELTA